MGRKLIPGPDMHILFEKGTRDEVSYMSNGYSKANNNYLKSYDLQQELNPIICLDTNNLHDYAVS